MTLTEDKKTNEYMSILSNETEVLHPEGKILLMNGNILECHQKADVPNVIKCDGVELDATDINPQTDDKMKLIR